MKAKLGTQRTLRNTLVMSAPLLSVAVNGKSPIFVALALSPLAVTKVSLQSRTFSSRCRCGVRLPEAPESGCAARMRPAASPDVASAA